MGLQDLPDELLDLICCNADQTTLRGLRLADRRLLPIATKQLFRHKKLWPDPLSVAKALCVLDSETINPAVTHFDIYAHSEDPEEDGHVWKPGDELWDPLEDWHWILDTKYKDVMLRIGDLKNLQHVGLNFRIECAAGSVLLPPEMQERTVERDEPLRFEWLRILLRGLNGEDSAATKVKTLTLKNMQDLPLPDDLLSKNFTTMFSRLTSLSLQITSGAEDNEPHREGYKSRFNEFLETHLKACWLEPVQRHLQHLKLYSARCYWGYTPECDLRDVHFPNLKSLELGKMTFTYDWQLDWILSYSETLEGLVLDRCPILHAAREYNEEEWGIRQYEARWHDYFRRIKDGMPKLKHFGCGSGPWKELRAFDEAWELPAEISTSRYCMYSTTITPWVEWKSGYEFVRNWGLGEYPMCEAEDQKALDELMAVISKRR